MLYIIEMLSFLFEHNPKTVSRVLEKVKKNVIAAKFKCCCSLQRSHHLG